jgi:hypothetical protein
MAPKSPAGFLYNFLGRAVQDPTNYRFLQQAAGDVLSRAVPKNVNWGGLPGQFLNTLSDISKMAPGAAKEAARTKAKTTLTRAAVSPPVRPTGQIGAGGLLRAPAVGTPPVRPPATTSAPSTALPGGGPFNIDYALRRATGFTGSPEQIAQKLGIPIDKLKSIVPPSPFSMPMEGMIGPSSPLGQITAKTSMFAEAPANIFQRGIGQVGGLFRNLQSRGPTALNPLATRIPTTTAGKIGKAFNPLNPVNIRDTVIGGAISRFIPEDDPNKGNAEIFAFTPGGLSTKIAATMLLGATSAGPEDEAALIRQYSRGNIRPFGGDASIKNEEGKVWAGQNYGFQSPESFNSLYGTNLPTTPGGTPPPAPVLPPPPEVVDRRAGQQIPPATPPVAPGTLSNGAGVPAQRQNVQQRALSQEVLNAAQQYSAPASVPLPSFYAGQQQLGRSMEQTGELQRQLTELGGATGMSNEALMQWAQANPDLAYRELMRLKGRSR